MALNEYPAGAAFPGVIGRTTDESSPAWPQPARPVPGSPNVLMVVLDDTGFGQLGCYGSPIATPNFDALAAERAALQQHAHDGAVLAEPVLHPHRPQPPQQRHGRHHRAGLGLPRLQRRHPVRERLPLRDAARARLQHLHGRQVAPDAEQPRDRRGALRPLAAGARLRALLRLPRRRDRASGIPELVYDNHQVEPPATPEEGYHLTEDLVDKSIAVHRATPSRSTPTSPSTCTSASVPRTPPTTCAKEWADRYAGQFDDGWDAYREKVFASQKELGIVPAGHASCPGTTRTSPTGTRCPRPARRLFSRMMEVFAGFLSHTDHHLGRLLDFLRERGELDNTHRHGDLRQRRQRRGRSHRHHQRGAVLQQRPGAARGQPRAHRRDRRPDAPSTTTRGAGRGPATRRSGGGSGRPTGAASPTRSSSPGRRASRPGARSARSTRTSSTWCPTVLDVLGHRAAGHDPGRDAVAAAGRQLREDLRRRRRRRATTTRSTSRCSAAGPSTTTAGGRSARGPGPRSPRRASGSGSPSRPRSSPSSTPPAGSSTTSTRTSRRTTTSPQANRDKLIALIGTWYVEAGKYGVMPIDGSGLQRMIAEKPQAAAPRDSYTYIPNTQSIPFFAGPRVLNRPHSITASVEIPEGGAEGVLLCQGSAAGGYSLFMKDGAAALRPQLRLARACTGSPPPSPSRPARTNSASSSSRRASRTSRTGEGRPGGCSSTSTGPSSPRAKRR